MATDPENLVLLCRGTVDSAVVAVHAAGGSGTGFRRLAAHWASDSWLYAFEALEASPTEQCTTAAIARRYWQQVVTAKLPRRIMFVGWSYGGHLAFEMARLAEQNGWPTPGVVFLDSATPAVLSTRTTRSATADLLAAVEGTPTDAADLSPFLEIHRWHLRAMADGISEWPAQGRVLVARAEDEPGWAGVPPDLGWSQVYGRDIEVRKVAGSHQTLASEKHAPALADFLAGVAERWTGASRLRPLSSIQQRLWYLWQLDDASSAYNVPFGWVVEAGIDRLRDAVTTLLRRHASLRSAFVIDEYGVPRRRVRDETTVPLLTVGSCEEVTEAIRMPFELAEGATRVLLLSETDGRVQVYFVCHHLVIDHWSVELLRHELARLLDCRPIDAPDAEYDDFVAAEAEFRRQPEYQAGLAYWRGATADLRPTTPPPDRTMAESEHGLAAEIRRLIPAAVYERLTTQATRMGVTFYATAVAATVRALGEWCDRDEVIIGVNVSKRTRPEFETVVGMYVDPIVLRVGAANGPLSLGAFVEHVWGLLLAGLEYLEVPYQDIVAASGLGGRNGANPLFNVVVTTSDVRGDDNGPSLRPVDVPLPRETKFPLSVEFVERSDGALLHIVYDEVRYTRSNVGRFADRITDLIEAIASDGAAAIAPAIADGGAPSPDRFARWFAGLRQDRTA